MGFECIQIMRDLLKYNFAFFEVNFASNLLLYSSSHLDHFSKAANVFALTRLKRFKPYFRSFHNRIPGGVDTYVRVGEGPETPCYFLSQCA